MKSKSFSLISMRCCLLISTLLPVHAQETGGELYQSACAACHGADGAGNSPAQLGFDIPIPDFTDCDFTAREPDPDWFAVIHEGGPVRGFDRMMPAFGQALDGDQIQRILDYVRTMCTDDRWPRGELNLPRALFTEKAYPEDEVIITSTIQGEGQDRMVSEFLWEYRFGPRSQFEIAVPVGTADFSGSEDLIGRVGDISVGFKHTLSYNMERGTILSVNGEIIVPTGDETLGFGKGTAVFEPSVSWGKVLPRDSFFQAQGLLEFPVESGFEEEIGARAAVGRTWTGGGPFGRAWTPMVEVLASKELTSGADIEWDVVPQFQVTLNTRQHIMANFGVRIPASDSSTRETQFVFYLLWEWFDGGIRDGW